MGHLSKLCIAALFSACIISVAAAAPGVTGVWNGHIKLDMSKLPKPTDPNQIKMMNDQIKIAEAVEITLTLKSDHTFLVTSSGKMASKPASGTYTSTATSVTIQVASKKGSPTPPSQTFTVAKDGKTLSMVQGPTKITFTR